MSLSGFGKSELRIIDKRKSHQDGLSDLGKGNRNRTVIMEKELEKATYAFEMVMEKNPMDKGTLNDLNLIKLTYALIIKRRKEMSGFFEKNKDLIEEYERKNLEFYNDKEDELRAYYENSEKEKLLFYIEYERKLREYRELEIYYNDIVKKFKSWLQRVDYLQNLLDELERDLSLSAELSGNSDKIGSSIGVETVLQKLPFDDTVSMQYMFDKMRISGENKGIQMFNSLNKSIFSLFDNIDGEELLDPLIDVIYSINPEITEDTFTSTFKDFVNGKIGSSDIDVFGYTIPSQKNYLLLRDKLMGFKTTVFFRKENYLYLFEIDGEFHYVKYKSDVGFMSTGTTGKFNSEQDIDDFFKDFLKLNVPN